MSYSDNEDQNKELQLVGKDHRLGPGSRIVVVKNCKHRGFQFYPSRKDQKYCSSSCRVLACYKRKNYAYQNGQYIRTEKNTQTLPVQQTQPDTNKNFDWNNFGESALASASVETAKYFLHDKPLMDKIDKVLHILSDSKLGGKIQYKGVQLSKGSPVALFVDNQGYPIINDHLGRWYKLISKNPVKWQQIKSPL